MPHSSTTATAMQGKGARKLRCCKCLRKLRLQRFRRSRTQDQETFAVINRQMPLWNEPVWPPDDPRRTVFVRPHWRRLPRAAPVVRVKGEAEPRPRITIRPTNT